jgi:SAM-dependent methyltransferase
MHDRMLEVLACPRDRATPLEARPAARTGSTISAGELVCPNCGSRFPITDGIPRFLALPDDEISEIKRREIAARDAASKKRTSWDLPTERWPELDALRAAVGDCRGARVLDAGCGVGLMTPAVRTAAHITALDFSWQGLMKFHFPYSAPLDLVQGDVCQLPFADNTFDTAISSQVLEHVPSEAARQAFLGELARTLKPAGRLVLTVYNWDLARQQRGVPKEGFHENGIFYHCYESEELRAALTPHFRVEAIWGLQVLLPLTYRLLAALGRKNVYWDRLWRRWPIARRSGRLLLGMARRV